MTRPSASGVCRHGTGRVSATPPPLIYKLILESWNLDQFCAHSFFLMGLNLSWVVLWDGPLAVP